MKESEWGKGREGLAGLLAACLQLLTFRPSFSLMSNLPPLTPTDCTMALGSTFTPSVKANKTWGWAGEPTNFMKNKLTREKHNVTKPVIISMQAALESYKKKPLYSKFIFSTSRNLVHQIHNLHELGWLENGRNISSAWWYGLCQRGSQRSKHCIRPESKERVAAYEKSPSTSSDFFHGPVTEVFREDLSHISFFREELNHFGAWGLSWRKEKE